MNRITPDFCWKRISVPKGLPALLEILAKEVIREQPKDIPTFLSNLIQDLIAKRDQEGDASSSTEASALLDKTLDKQESSSDPQFEEALAASKIQAGFRGYKTRKALKSRNSKKGGELSLTSLTPLNNTTPTPKNDENKDDESDEDKQKRLDKMADEEIAAELKTPLETIREESFDKSPQIKSPEALSEVNKLEESESIKNIPNPSPQPIIGKLDEICEEEEKDNLQEIHDNLSEEFGNVSLDDAKTESLDLELEIMEEDLRSSPSNDIREESDADRELMEKHVNQLLKSENVEIAVEEEDQTSISQSLAAIDDKASEDIHESEVETMMVEEIENNSIKVNGRESNCEESPINKHDEKIEAFKESKEEIDLEKVVKVVSSNDVESGDNSEPVSLSVEFEYQPEDSSFPVIQEKAATSPDAKLEENNSDLVEKSDININVLLNKCDTDQINSIDVEKPKYDQLSFANNDSISSSATTVNSLHFHKNEDTSQDTSSLSETPKPKPRKALTETVTLVDETEKPTENVSEEPQPVLRRQKSSPKARGKAVASKYRSGMVVDDGVSMEEMEAQIETEMMAQAATRIQAGFRGYKTRKSMRHSGVSKSDDGDVSGGKKKAKLSTSEDGESPIMNESLAASAVNYAMASASADRITALKRDTKPGFMRSRSYPEDEGAAAALDETNVSKREPLPDVELDPTYVNIAAIRIQSSFRGYLVRKSLKTKKRGNRQLSHSDSEKASKVKFEVGDPQLTRDFTLDLADPPNAAEEKHDSQQRNELSVSPADRGISPAPSDSEMAAIKIQSAFRGMRDRQKVKQTKKAAVVIQATVRGFLTRRRLMKLRRRSVQRRRSSAKSMISSDEKLQKANDAAIKIQSIYRGYQVRSRIKRSGTDE